MTLEQTKSKGIGEPDNLQDKRRVEGDTSLTKSGGGAIKTAKKTMKINKTYSESSSNKRTISERERYDLQQEIMETACDTYMDF